MTQPSVGRRRRHLGSFLGGAARAAFNLRARARIWWNVTVRRRPIADLIPFEMKVYSQNGEDGILRAIFERIGTTNRFFVEFGAEDGNECNSRWLRERGWDGLLMDVCPARGRPDIKSEFITAENIEALLAKYGVPAEPDLLSIDIDGNDYWVWKAVSRYRPRVVVVEYNGSIPARESRVIAYEPGFRWDGTRYFGASLRALAALGRSKGYTLVACDSRGVNAFFVGDRLVQGAFDVPGADRLYRPLWYAPGWSARDDWVWLE